MYRYLYAFLAEADDIKLDGKTMWLRPAAAVSMMVDVAAAAVAIMRAIVSFN